MLDGLKDMTKFPKPSYSKYTNKRQHYGDVDIANANDRFFEKTDCAAVDPGLQTTGT